MNKKEFQSKFKKMSDINYAHRVIVEVNTHNHKCAYFIADDFKIFWFNYYHDCIIIFYDRGREIGECMLKDVHHILNFIFMESDEK